MKNDLIVIIVTFNAMEWIDRCINSLKNSSVKNDIYIVDNGSTDGTVDYIGENFPNIVLSVSESNLGFGRANNLGFIYAIKNNYKYVYLLNQDAWVMQDTFEKIISAYRENPQFGILSPMQLQADQKHFDQNFGYNISKWDNKIKFCEELYFYTSNKIYEMPRIMAAHWFISIECLRKIGGFSPSYSHYGEDDNFADRVLHKGFKIGAVIGANAVHDRKYRRLTPNQIIYLSYIEMITKYSGWDQDKSKSLFLYTLRCIKHIFIYRTIKPLNYYLKIISGKRMLIRNRELSEKDLAFINQDI